ncbi:hypothetical protein B7486_58750, partial [cyanobacterium TDX16]
MSLADHPTQVHPGSGIVAHLGSTIVVVLPSTAEHRTTAKEVLDAAREAVDGGGVTVVRRLAGVLGETDPEDAPPVAVLADAGDGGETAVLLHGPIDAVVHQDGDSERLSGASVSSWVDRVLPAGWSRLELVATGSEAPPYDPLVDLREGTVAGSGVTVASAAAPSTTDGTDPPTTPVAAAPAPPPPPTTTGASSPAPREFVAISFDDADDDVDDRTPLKVVTAEVAEEPPDDDVPKVLGTVCKNGHFNDPDVLYCATCGISMAQQTQNLVEGPRPALGVLVLDDGATFLVDSDYVIGRDPHHAPEVGAGQARPLVLTDTQRTLSRVHAKVVLDGWQVMVVDAGSANGTYVAEGDAQQWTPVGAHAPVPIRPGTHLLVGHRTFVFETH